MQHGNFGSRIERLPRGQVYPVKPWELSRAVEAAGLRLRFEFTLWDQGAGLVADYRPAGHAPWLTDDSVWVRCRAVSAAHADEARATIEREAIPQLIEWARAIEASDPASPKRRERQSFVFPLNF